MGFVRRPPLAPDMETVKTRKVCESETIPLLPQERGRLPVNGLPGSKQLPESLAVVRGSSG